MADQYALAAARMSALSLIDASGFDYTQQSCADILADLLLRYVQEVGEGSHHYAELAGRSETNPVDVTLALNDMGTSVAQLRDFLHYSQEVPFEHNISAFPLRKQSKPAPTFMERGEVPPPHIPPWLPALPDKHTYMATPVYTGHEKDPQKQQMMLTEQRQQAETAAVRLQARLAAGSNQLLVSKLKASRGEATEEQQEVQGLAEGTAAGQQHEPAQAAAGKAGKAEVAVAASNPFLAAPWGEVTVEAGQQRQSPLPGSAQAGAARGSEGGEQQHFTGSQDQGPKVVWESADFGPSNASSNGSGRFIAQQLFATRDWKAQQERKARIATSGRAVHEAFEEAYDELAAVRLGKRQKRGTAAAVAAAAAAAASDPTRARVEHILSAHAQQLRSAAGTGQNDVMQEQI